MPKDLLAPLKRQFLSVEIMGSARLGYGNGRFYVFHFAQKYVLNEIPPDR